MKVLERSESMRSNRREDDLEILREVTGNWVWSWNGISGMQLDDWVQNGGLQGPSTEEVGTP